MSLLGNKKSNQFHDLTREKPQCAIAHILPLHRHTFVPDTVDQAIAEGFEPCYFCIGTIADLLLSGGSGQVLPSASDVAGVDQGGGQVTLRWSYSLDIDAQQVSFDVYSSEDPLDPFRSLRLDRGHTLSTVITGLLQGGDIYFTVIARRAAQLSLPSRTLKLFVQPVLQQVVPGAPSTATKTTNIGFPFHIDSKGSIFAQGGDPVLRGKILQLLLTSPGERVCLPDYGTRLRDLVFDPNNDILAATTEFMVTRALQKYLGDQIQVSQVSVLNSDNVLNVDIVYVKKSDLRLEKVRLGIPAS